MRILLISSNVILLAAVHGVASRWKGGPKAEDVPFRQREDPRLQEKKNLDGHETKEHNLMTQGKIVFGKSNGADNPKAKSAPSESDEESEFSTDEELVEEMNDCTSEFSQETEAEREEDIDLDRIWGQTRGRADEGAEERASEDNATIETDVEKTVREQSAKDILASSVQSFPKKIDKKEFEDAVLAALSEPRPLNQADDQRQKLKALKHRLDTIIKSDYGPSLALSSTTFDTALQDAGNVMVEKTLDEDMDVALELVAHLSLVSSTNSRLLTGAISKISESSTKSPETVLHALEYLLDNRAESQVIKMILRNSNVKLAFPIIRRELNHLLGSIKDLDYFAQVLLKIGDYLGWSIMMYYTQGEKAPVKEFDDAKYMIARIITAINFHDEQELALLLPEVEASIREDASLGEVCRIALKYGLASLSSHQNMPRLFTIFRNHPMISNMIDEATEGQLINEYMEYMSGQSRSGLNHAISMVLESKSRALVLAMIKYLTQDILAYDEMREYIASTLIKDEFPPEALKLYLEALESIPSNVLELKGSVGARLTEIKKVASLIEYIKTLWKLSKKTSTEMTSIVQLTDMGKCNRLVAETYLAINSKSKEAIEAALVKLEAVAGRECSFRRCASALELSLGDSSTALSEPPMRLIVSSNFVKNPIVSETITKHPLKFPRLAQLLSR